MKNQGHNFSAVQEAAIWHQGNQPVGPDQQQDAQEQRTASHFLSCTSE
jgi:hypothetical protein